MDISQYGTSQYVDPIMADAEKYGLFKHIAELEAYGMTVVPPATMGVDDAFADRLRGAILKTCEARNDVEIGDYRTANPPMAKTRSNTWDLLEEDDVFVEAAINPVLLTLVRWLLGQSAVFSGQTWIIKGQGGHDLGLHSDSHGIPPGAGHIAHMCNASWLCTDYVGEEDGPTVFVPGSHVYGRATLTHETNLENTPFKTFPLIGKAGSLAIWNGAVWHGSLPRTKEGLRVTLVQNYMRSYMRPQHEYDRDTSPELLERYPELARLIGKPLYPYLDSQNPDPERIAPFMLAGRDPFA